MGAEGLYVVGALAERRQVDRYDAQAIVEVFAEGAGFDGGGEIYMGRRDDACFQGARLGFADPLEGPPLDDTQELRLQVAGHVADLVEEDRSVGGCFESTDAVSRGAGKCAAHMAEKLALEEGRGEGGAVDGDEGGVAMG